MAPIVVRGFARNVTPAWRQLAKDALQNNLHYKPCFLVFVLLGCHAMKGERSTSSTKSTNKVFLIGAFLQ